MKNINPVEIILLKAKWNNKIISSQIINALAEISTEFLIKLIEFYV